MRVACLLLFCVCFVSLLSFLSGKGIGVRVCGACWLAYSCQFCRFFYPGIGVRFRVVGACFVCVCLKYVLRFLLFCICCVRLLSFTFRGGGLGFGFLVLASFV